MKKLPKNKLDGKTILVTGGTGSFGKIFVKYILDNYQPESIRIFSRDELKQWNMKRSFASHKYAEKLRFLIGDVRDANRLDRACHDVDVIIHAAALKHVPVCENDPIEAIKTNVNGAINVIDAALDNKVADVIALSTDKASQPINLYGATKLCSDKLFIQANSYRGNLKSKFSVVRYGNVMGSRGSVIPLFLEQKQTGFITITDGRMTRFWLPLPIAIEFVVSSLDIMQGGELFIPKIPSMNMENLAKAVAPEASINVIGLRPGEKMHESLISVDEALNTFDLGDRFMLAPTNLITWNNDFKYQKKRLVPSDFSYTSENNSDYLTISQMKNLIKKYSYTFSL